MEEVSVRKFLLASLAAATVLATMPASAQVFVGADRSGAGIQVGPFGVGVGPRFGWGHRDYDRDYAYRDYAYGCRLVRERIVTPGGHVIWRTHRDCD
jgi:hypothetical protein